MKQKLIVVAVAGALAIPAVASAQVKISGKFGLQLTNMRLSDVTNAGVRLNTNRSSTYMNDNVSVIQFAAEENLGGGLTAFGQYQFRPLLDGNGGTTGSVPSGSTTPISFVGLKSSSWGDIRAGSLSTWGSVGSGFSPSSSANYSSSAILNYVIIAGTSPTAIHSSRQSNTILYTTPNFKNGFKAVLGWSTAAKSADSDMLNTYRKGQTWYAMPQFNAGSWAVGYAYADQKTETGTPYDMKSHKIWGTVKIAGIDLGLTYAKHKAKLPLTGADAADVKKWLLPVRYRSGNNTFAFMLAHSGDDKLQAGDQKAKLTALSYNYSLSKRTNMGVTWIKMTNSTGAAFDITNSGSSSYAAAGASALAGEDQSMIGFTVNHSF